MRRGIKRRLRDRRGFSVGEMMAALLILLMVTGVVAAGVPVAAEVYKGVVDASNAQALLSTATVALRSQLETAENTITESSNHKSISYYSGSSTMYTTIACVDTRGDRRCGLWLLPYETYDSETGAFTEYTEVVSGQSTYPYSRLLVSSQTITENLSVGFTSITYDGGTKMFTITGLGVWHLKNGAPEGAPIIQLPTFYVRAASAEG